MSNKISELDTFGESFSFTTAEKEDSYKTCVGGIITLIGYLIVVLISVRIFLNFIDTESPVVSVNRIRLKEAPALDLFKSKIGTSITTVNLLSGEFLTVNKSAARFMTVKGEVVTTTQKPNGDRVEEIQKVNVRDCESLENQGTFKSIYDQYDSQVDTTNLPQTFLIALTSTPKNGLSVEVSSGSLTDT